MKNGDFSVVLKNVSINDTGMYECLVTTPSNNRRRRDVRNRVFRGSVHLFVSEGSEKHLKNGDANDEQPRGPGGNVWWGAVLGVGLGLVVLIVGAQFCCKMSKSNAEEIRREFR
ncbi:hypothetical protein OYC64_001243 [Pagothenia borchgrevinki]|uniref:Immunoglobulin V-set domain-containing protein n=1 Tax=Pagothenia borchgrevinki TaxID=8213 RepID=A0ABD2GAC1_PAGBO